MFATAKLSRARSVGWFGAAAGLLLWHCVAFAAAPVPGTNQGPAYAVHVWKTGNGLPQNSVISMVQTRDGYLWLGTLNGLARFDGIRFTVFDEGNTPGLNDSRIVTLFEDSSGVLWIGTETGGTVMMKDGRIIAPPELSAGGVERRLIAACEDTDGAVWLYNASGDVWRYHQQRFTPFLLNAPDRNQPRSIIKETNGPVWLATARRQYAIGSVGTGGSLELPVSEELAVGQIDRLVPGRRGGYWRLANLQIQRWVTNRFEQDLGRYPWSRGISAACEDQEGNLVVGTQGAGLFWVNPRGEVTSLSTNEGLSNNYILSLAVDREGTLWVGTDGGGLNRVRRQTFASLEPVRNWTVASVMEDTDGGLWIASNGEGVGYWRHGTLQLRSAGLSDGYVKSVFVDRDQRVWAGMVKAGLFQFANGRFHAMAAGGVIPPLVQAVFQDRIGQLWFGTAAGLVRFDGREWKRYTAQEGLTSDNITALADDTQGNLWIGTRRGGICRLREERFTAFRKADGLPGDDISSLRMDAQGILWVATYSSGLARFHNGRWTRCTTREGLASNNLGYMVEDGDGNLWIGSNAGVLRVAKKALNDLAEGVTKSVPCRAFGEADGLPTLECTTGSQPGAWRGKDGKLWFPTITGLAFVDPARLTPNTNPPPVSIESVLIDDEPLSADQAAAGNLRSITMRPDQERLEIQYTALNLGAAERARFKYRLEGYEKDWRDAGGTRAASYTRLSPGHYTFRVTACNEDGVWNETGSALAVIVQPPFWRTWWFLGTTAVCVFGVVAGIVRYLSTQKLLRQVAVLKQQEALEKERARIARDIHDQVGASLTQVALLGEMVETDKDLPHEVQSHAQQISQTARETTRALDEIVWTVNPQNDTLEGLINYICKHAQEFLAIAGLRYRLEVPEHLPAAPISPEVRHNVFLAAKEAVTNVVRHAKATSAWVRLRVEPDSFTLEIEDNGRGIPDPDAPSLRNGLRNMRKRMEDVGGTFTIGRGSEGGALVRLTVPLARNKVTNATGAQ